MAFMEEEQELNQEPVTLNEAQQALAEEIDTEYARELLEEESTVEALLFTMGGSVSLEQLVTLLELSPSATEAAAKRLMERYEKQNGGMVIRRFENRYQMCTNPRFYEALIRVAKQPRKPVLTEVVMETLSIIAYRQPVTKAEIEKIRGVKSDHAVNKLVEYELVQETGRLNAPGRPALFATTEEFLRRFGVPSLTELPGLNPEIQAEIESEVREEANELLGPEEQPEHAVDQQEDLEEQKSGEPAEPAEQQENSAQPEEQQENSAQLEEQQENSAQPEEISQEDWNGEDHQD